LPIILSAERVDRLFRQVEDLPGYRMIVNLQEQQITTQTGDTIQFEVDNFRKDCLLRGLDDIGLTLQHAGEILEFEERRRQEAPWLFDRQD